MQYGLGPNYNPPTFRNVIVNGDMQIAQIGNGVGFPVNLNAASPTNADNINNADGWYWQRKPNASLVAIFNDTQELDHPTLPNGMSKRITVTAVQPAVAANQNARIGIGVEGRNFSNLFGLLCTLSFWVKSPKTGNHYCAITNPNWGVTQISYVMQFTVNQANTWEQKKLSVNFSGLTPGEFNFTDDSGVFLEFPLCAGANFQTATFSKFIGIVAYGGADTPNLLDTIGNIFAITDVQLEPGVVQTPFDRLPFGVALQNNQRYLQHSFEYSVRPKQNDGTAGTRSFTNYSVTNAGVSTKRTQVYLSVELQNAPLATFYNTSANNALWRNLTLGADSGAAVAEMLGEKTFSITNAQVVGDAVSNRIAINWRLDSTIVALP